MSEFYLMNEQELVELNGGDWGSALVTGSSFAGTIFKLTKNPYATGGAFIVGGVIGYFSL